MSLPPHEATWFCEIRANHWNLPHSLSFRQLAYVENFECRHRVYIPPRLYTFVMICFKEVWHEIFSFWFFHKSVSPLLLNTLLEPKIYKYIIRSKGQSPVSTTPAIVYRRCRCYRRCINHHSFQEMISWRNFLNSATILGTFSWYFPIRYTKKSYLWRASFRSYVFSRILRFFSSLVVGRIRNSNLELIISFFALFGKLNDNAFFHTFFRRPGTSCFPQVLWFRCSILVSRACWITPLLVVSERDISISLVSLDG